MMDVSDGILFSLERALWEQEGNFPEPQSELQIIEKSCQFD